MEEGCECYEINPIICETCYYQRAHDHQHFAGDPFRLGRFWFRFAKINVIKCPFCDEMRHRLYLISLGKDDDNKFFHVPRNGPCVYCVIESAGLFNGSFCIGCFYHGQCLSCKKQFLDDNEKEQEEELIRQKEELIALLKKEESKI